MHGTSLKLSLFFRSLLLYLEILLLAAVVLSLISLLLFHDVSLVISSGFVLAQIIIMPLFTLMLTRVMYLRYKYIPEGNVAGGQSIMKCWDLRGLFPLFGKIALFGDSGIFITSRLHSDPKSNTSFFIKIWEQLFLRRSDETLIPVNTIRGICLQGNLVRMHTGENRYSTIHIQDTQKIQWLRAFCLRHSIPLEQK